VSEILTRCKQRRRGIKYNQRRPNELISFVGRCPRRTNLLSKNAPIQKPVAPRHNYNNNSHHGTSKRQLRTTAILTYTS